MNWITAPEHQSTGSSKQTTGKQDRKTMHARHSKKGERKHCLFVLSFFLSFFGKRKIACLAMTFFSPPGFYGLSSLAHKGGGREGGGGRIAGNTSPGISHRSLLSEAAHTPHKKEERETKRKEFFFAVIVL